METSQSSESGQSGAGKGVIGWFICCGALLLLYVILGWFDNTTELTPSHDTIDSAIFWIAGVLGVVSSVTAVYISTGWAVWRRIGFAFIAVLMGVLLGFMASYRTANIVEGLIDFPRTKTQSFPALLLISRAYQTHGKGGNWNIQTTPIWSNLDITENDYKFMLARRRPGDDSQNPDEISSKGYFCARVTIERSGNALRVMNAGSRTLSIGTVIICPAPASKR